MSAALIMWKVLVLFTGSQSPVVVVLSESMEPGFQRVSFLILMQCIWLIFKGSNP